MHSTLDISPQTAAIIAAQAGMEGVSVETYVRTLLEARERVEAIAGIQKGLLEMNRGEGRPAEAFFKEFFEKHGIPEA